MNTFIFKDGEVYSCEHTGNFKKYRNKKLLQKHGDFRTAYLIENDLDSLPICKFCNTRELKQLGYDNFKDSCCHPECILERTKEVNIEIGKRKVEKRKVFKSEVESVLERCCVYCDNTFVPHFTMDDYGNVGTVDDNRCHCYSKNCTQAHRNTTMSLSNYVKFKSLASEMINFGTDVSEDLVECNVGYATFTDRRVNQIKKQLDSGKSLWWNMELNRLEIPKASDSTVMQYRYASSHKCPNCGTYFTGRSKYCGHDCYWEMMRSGKYVRTVTDEEREIASVRLKTAIQNGTFTPYTNTFTNVIVTYCGVRYRSTWEVLFAIIQELRGNVLEYETLRLTYEIDGRTRTYITDFIDHNAKIVYEIKPSSRMTRQSVILKDAALVEWCSTHGYTRVFVSENYFTLSLRDDILYARVSEKASSISDVFVSKYVNRWRNKCLKKPRLKLSQSDLSEHLVE